MLKIHRRQENAIPSWRADAKVLATRARIAELDAYLAKAHARIAEHDRAVADADRAVERAEVAVLAGRGTDRELAVQQSRHLELRRERAKEVIAVEDAQAERAKLVEALPTIEKKAKQAAYAAIRQRAAALAREMRATITALVQSDIDYAALRAEAEAEFPYEIREAHSAQYDPDFKPVAGLSRLSRTRMNGLRTESEGLTSATHVYLEEIDALLAELAG